MPEPSKHGAQTRRPVVHGGRKIPNLSVRALDDGTDVYEVRLRMPDGSQPRVKLEARTPSEAVRERNGLLVDRDRGVAHENALMNPTVAELMDEYIAQMQARVGITDDRRRYSQGTVDVCASMNRRHIAPQFACKRVGAVTTADLRRFVVVLQAKGLAPGSVGNALQTLGNALTFAVRSGYIDRNPAADLDRQDRPGRRRLSEPRYLTAAEVAALLAEASDQLRPLYACCAFAALRIGEAFGLPWECVDFKADTITVRQQLNRYGQVSPHLKTVSSAATLPLLPSLKRELLEHRSRMAGIDLQRLRPEALVFLSVRGRPLCTSVTRKELTRAATAAGLNPPGAQPIGHHDLRHSAAALAFEAGAPDNQVAEFLRHANAATTNRVYSGLTRDGRGGAARRLLDAGFGA